MTTQTNILIVTTTEVESQAVLQAFEKATHQAATLVSIKRKTYHQLGPLNGSDFILAQCEMGSSGLGASLLTVQKGIAAFGPQAVVMVGIAFGMNSQKQVLGEILVSQQLFLYDLQRVGTTPAGQVNLILRGDRPHASPWLVDLFRSTSLHWDGAAVRFGLMLSGEKLLDNRGLRDQLRWLQPEALGGEMEGAGLYVAAENEKVDWILVKAISDWADGHKARGKAQRQRLAAANAATFIVQAFQAVAPRASRRPLVESKRSPKGSPNGVSKRRAKGSASTPPSDKPPKEPAAPANDLPRLKVFLCHSSGDRTMVHQLYERLKADRVDPWLDQIDLLPGQVFDLEIQRAVRQADNIIICLSRASVTKEGYLQKEIRYALNVAAEQPEGTIFLIPLRLEECSLPDRLRELQYVNYFDTHGYDQLLTALRVRAQLQGRHPPRTP